MSTFTRRAGIGAAVALAAVLAVPTTANADDLVPANHAPLAYDQSITVYQNTPYPVTLTGSDPDLNDGITYDVQAGPNHGLLESGNTALRKYTPAAGYSGPDVIKFRTVDSHGLASVLQGTITINVIPAVQANRPPAAVNQSLSTSLNTPIAVKLTGTDPDLDPLSFLLNAPAPQHGTLSGSTPNLTYTPNTGFVGTDSFGFKADDGRLQSPLGTITITVAKPNTPPVAKNISATTIQNRSVGITLSGYDADSDAITFNTPSKPAHGTVSGTGANVTYTPDKWFHGIDSFTYTVSDGKATSAPATVTVVVRGFKHRPVAYDQSVATGVRQPVKIHLNGWSGENDDLDFIIVDRPEHGRLIQNGDDVVYVPYRHFRGYDSFDFIVRDEDGNTSRPATVDIKVKSYWKGYSRR